MDAVKFLKEAKRLCETQEGYCFECPLKEHGCILVDSGYVSNGKPIKFEEAVSTVEKWAEEHPVKTRQSEFLKMFPNAKIDNGCICICPKDADATLHEKLCVPFCKTCLREYWLAEVE